MNKFIVVDDFYRDPSAVRNLAIDAAYKRPPQGSFPGWQSLQEFITPALVSKLETLVGQPISIDRSQYSFGRFRYTVQSLESRPDIHIDKPDWTGVLYLTSANHCRGGTGFFRHLATAYEGGLTDSELVKEGFLDLEDFERRVILPDRFQMDAWEKTSEVEMKFNRLVLFRGRYLFHSPTEFFGDSIATGRLTQNFFFDEIMK